MLNLLVSINFILFYSHFIILNRTMKTPFLRTAYNRIFFDIIKFGTFVIIHKPIFKFTNRLKI